MHSLVSVYSTHSSFGIVIYALQEICAPLPLEPVQYDRAPRCCLDRWSRPRPRYARSPAGTRSMILDPRSTVAGVTPYPWALHGPKFRIIRARALSGVPRRLYTTGPIATEAVRRVRARNPQARITVTRSMRRAGCGMIKSVVEHVRQCSARRSVLLPC